jgi:hypothetical protein
MAVRKSARKRFPADFRTPSPGEQSPSVARFEKKRSSALNRFRFRRPDRCVSNARPMQANPGQTGGGEKVSARIAEIFALYSILVAPRTTLGRARGEVRL